jgi:flagellar biosynthesis protein FlhG
MPERLAEFWAFVSGKGGVGKSVLALNAARVLTEAGKKVLLLDADLGLANLHVLANVEPRGRLERILARAERLEDAITPLAFGADLLAADNGQHLSMLSSAEAAEELALALGTVNAQYDYILVDTPRGITEPSLHFCRACDRTLLVTTSEPTAITNSYAWYKIATLDGTRVPTWLVANGTSDASLPQRFGELCRRFLGHAPAWAGTVPHDPDIVRSVALQTPVFELNPESPAWKAIQNFTHRLQKIAPESLRKAVTGPAAGDCGATKEG